MAATFTADTEALANALALAYEDLDLTDLHPGMAARYRGLAADLVGQNLPREMKVIAEVLALCIEDAGHLDQIAPWDVCRHLDVAEDILARF
ncbi:hypothetical protein [Streptomyces canus]|uniref:hypothetical protein n=1 Tax=Streptomyces canus TaxID=58343 RepID=UPI00277EE9E9|nr:hypothetical protein [Streptomyces canus]MDQ0762029.1 hypothetical protein [Streptomyces canus]